MKAPASRFDSRRNLQIYHAGMARFGDIPASTGDAQRRPHRFQEVRKPNSFIIQLVRSVKPEGETMNHTEQRKKLRTVLAGSKCLAPASVYDPLSARVAEAV